MNSPPTIEPPVEVEYQDRPGPSRAERDQWPYLAGHHCAGIRNGREAGMFLIGHLFGRAMHDERGLRVVLPTEYVDGAVVALVAAGATVQHNYDLVEPPPDQPGARSCLDIWV